MKHRSLDDYRDAIRHSNGLLSVAARHLGLSRQAVHSRVRANSELTELLEETRAELLDLAESRLFEAVQNGHMSAVFFVLRTLGKGRGYSYGVESSLPRLSQADLASLSDDELDEMIRVLN